MKDTLTTLGSFFAWTYFRRFHLL